MKADFDFRPSICEAIRINGWDDANHPTLPDTLNSEKWKFHDISVNGNNLAYCIESTSFILANKNSMRTLQYSVDRNGTLIIQSPEETQVIGNTEDGMFITGDELLIQKNPIEWLISDWIPKGKGLIQLYGASGTGKSFLCHDWILSIVTGIGKWNECCCFSGKAVYLCGEGQRGVSKRVKAWLQHHGISEEEAKRLLHDNLRILSSSSMLTLDNKTQLAEMQTELDKESFIPDLIVVDTLNRFQQGNENDTRDSTVFVHACDALASKYDCVVLLVHHVGWANDAQNRARGSSVIHSSVDMDFMLSDRNGTLELSQTKNKDFERTPAVYLKLKSVSIENEDSTTETSAVLIPSEKPEVEIAKDNRRLNDEVLCLEAFKVFGVDKDGVITISVSDMKRYCSGKLTDKKGIPYEDKTPDFNNQFNPNQSTRFIGRLISYRVVESIYDRTGKVAGWRLLDDEMIGSYRIFNEQQPTLA